MKPCTLVYARIINVATPQLQVLQQSQNISKYRLCDFEHEMKNTRFQDFMFFLLSVIVL